MPRSKICCHCYVNAIMDSTRPTFLWTLTCQQCHKLCHVSLLGTLPFHDLWRVNHDSIHMSPAMELQQQTMAFTDSNQSSYTLQGWSVTPPPPLRGPCIAFWLSLTVFLTQDEALASGGPFISQCGRKILAPIPWLVKHKFNWIKTEI